MRLWSIHPKYLDTKGLLAVWREGLLAQKVLAGGTKGYKRHPQLLRFRESENPEGLIGSYLMVVFEEAVQRGYTFEKSKINHIYVGSQIFVTSGQIQYEWQHLIRKFSMRDRTRYDKYKDLLSPDTHPIFTMKQGPIETWEKVIDHNH